VCGTRFGGRLVAHNLEDVPAYTLCSFSRKPSAPMTVHASKVPHPVFCSDLRQRAELMAAKAAEAADKVDQEARFPSEAFAAARSQRLLGIQVPIELGGEAASVSDVADVCYILGRACASAGMIFAMHQIAVTILVRHATDSIWHRRLLLQLCAEQLLLASSTTEGQGGGNLRSSICAVENCGAGIIVAKSATVVSYGTEADGILTTARRAPDAPTSDQVMVAFTRDNYRLDPAMNWNALGMRGTCSSGYALKARGERNQVLPQPYQSIHSQTMMPVAHLMWSSVWTGVAAGAIDRGKRFVRTAARNGQMPPGATHLTRATATLRALRGMVASALQQYESAAGRPEALEALDFQTSMNLLKVNASELASSTVMSVLQTCGLAGYRNDGEISVSRHVRDILSASIMINNDRILASTTKCAMLAETPALLREEP
jgi:acyl-CoA dehydrogenase